MDRFLRTNRLLDDEKMNSLKNAHVMIFGVGGVGGYVVEALVRSGVGKVSIIDNDIILINILLSNIKLIILLNILNFSCKNMFPYLSIDNIKTSFMFLIFCSFNNLFTKLLSKFK